MSNISLLTAHSQNNQKNEIKPNMEVVGFIENKGQIHDQYNQTNRSVKYLLLSKGMNVQLKANSFSYDVYTAINNSEKETGSKKDFDKFKKADSLYYTFHRVDISLLGCNPSPVIVAEEKSTDYLLYYTPNLSEGAMAYYYRKITYKEIYPHIDLVFVSGDDQNKKAFEYFFVVRPGGNVNNIKLQYSGATSQIKNNKIQISLEQGTINERIPESFLVNKDQLYPTSFLNDEKINIHFKVLGKNQYGFAVPFYDRTKTLIIDPTPDLIWGTYYGGSLNDWAKAITRDNNGDLIIAGATSNNSNMATTGAFQTTYEGNEDGIVGKFQANGNRVWVTYYGGNSSEDIFSVTTDAGNNIFFGGTTGSDAGIATPGSQQPVKAYGVDCFIAKFTPSGSRIWATYYGGEDVDYVSTLKTDAAGNLFVAGWTGSTTGIATAGSYQPNYGGGVLNDADDGFMAKFSNDGVLQWATYYGGPSFDRFYGMDLDNSGNIYATGITSSTTGISSPGAFQTSFGGGNNDAFVVKFDRDGNRIWATYYGGPGEDFTECIVVDHQNNIIAGGETISSSGISTTGSHQPVFGGNTRDGFLVKLNPNGNRIWGTYYGGNGEEYVLAVACDTNDNILFTGWTYSTTGIATSGSYQPSGGGLAGIWTTFVVKLNSNCTRQWGTYYGSNGAFGQGIGYGIVTDPAGNVFVTGCTSFTSGIATCNAVQSSWAGNFDIFLAEFSETLTPAPSISISANPNGTICAGTAINFAALAVNAGTTVSYQWEVNGVAVGGNSPTFTSTSLLNGDMVSCQLSTFSSSCSAATIVNSNSITVSVTSPVTPALTITSSATSICSGNSVTFTASSTNGGATPVYQWYDNGALVGSNNPVFTTTGLSNGDMINCTLTSSNGCVTSSTAVSNSILITVNTITLPSILISASSNPVCPGDIVTFSSSVMNSPASPAYQWQVNGNNSGGNTIAYSTSTLSDGDMISCILSGTAAGCSSAINVSSNTIVISVKDAPIVNIFPADTSIFWGDSVQLNATVTGIAASFEWTPSLGLSNPSILTPIASPAETTTYIFAATGSDGCRTSTNATVNVFRDVFIPTAFTPNHDGKNDLFRIPPGISLSLTRFSIYDRWGNEIFQTTDRNKGWDGTFKGTELPVGVYIYIIEGHSPKGKVSIKGTVTLIR